MISTVMSNNNTKNPLIRGCLYERLPNWDKKRVCNSEDGPDAADASLGGWCRDPTAGDGGTMMEHLEIRLYSPSYDTPYFHNWLLQILLSEMLDIPTTIETGATPYRYHNTFASLYDPEDRYYFHFPPLGQPKKAVSNAKRLNQDCSLAKRTDQHETYEPCAHYFPEIWNREQEWIQGHVREGNLQVPSANGMVGSNGIFVTKFTANQEPKLLHYLGMQGEENREMLANLFLTPTTWGDYCTKVSNNSCTVPDGVAERLPLSSSSEDDDVKDEREQYFVEGL